MIIRKSQGELDKMRRSGLLVYEILQKLGQMVREGVTTLELELAAEKLIRDAGARPAFKGYYTAAAGSKYPFALCASVNEEIVHGMPSAKRAMTMGMIGAPWASTIGVPIPPPSGGTACETPRHPSPRISPAR